MNAEKGNDFKSFVGQYKDRVYDKICEYLPIGDPKEYHDMVRVYVDRKGKYGRPGYLLLWTGLYGGNLEDAILPAAVQQASEDWILMHDDIMDQNPVRRNGPAAHVMFGEKYAINAGDELHMIMWKMIKDAMDQLGMPRSDAYFSKVYDMLLTTAEGQYKDISLTDKPDITKFTAEDYYNSIHAKTAYYSIYGPMQTGALIAGAPASVVEGIKEYGTLLGNAFQIKDDILDCTATEEELGKSVGNDVREGVKTIILWHAVHNASPKDLERMKTIYATPREKKSEEDVKWVIGKFSELGSIDYAQKEGERLVIEGSKIFEKHAKSIPESKFKEIARNSFAHIVHRKK